jgi:hypothetical protein
MRALAALVDAHRSVTVLDGTVVKVIRDGARPRVEVAAGETFESEWV